MIGIEYTELTKDYKKHYVLNGSVKKLHKKMDRQLLNLMEILNTGLKENKFQKLSF